jgi:3',5'-cyclic-AMP phosphodiesterase
MRKKLGLSVMSFAKELIWLTDVHLDSVDVDERNQFFKDVGEHPSQIVLVGGDIADGRHALSFLKILREETNKKIYFVLGNHDYYGESIFAQRKKALELCAQDPKLCYLTKNGVVQLTDEIALVGHDGWADGQAGEFLLSTVCLRDYFEIQDLKGRSVEELRTTLGELGKQAASELEVSLLAALKQYPKVVVLTHAPPFRKVCLYQGHETNDLWAPHFVSFAVGEMLSRVLQSYPEKKCLVLAGHSHSYAHAMILPNLEAKVAEADLGHPAIQFVELSEL